MSLNSFINKLGSVIKTKFEELTNDNELQGTFSKNYSIDACIFAGADLDTFKSKIAQGMNLESSDSIFYQNINNAGVEDVFDCFDKNGDGKISEEEISEISSVDNNEDTISSLDMMNVFNSLAYKDILDTFDELVKAGQIDPQQANTQAMQNYTSNIGGSNYQNYGSQTQNGSTISSEEQYSTKDKLDKIENEEIPELEKQREETIQEYDEKIENEKKNLDELIEENKEELGELGEDYNKKQKEIEQCDSKISEYDTKINEEKSKKHESESTLKNLEAELGALDTETNDEEINKTNKERKSEIETQIKELEEKIAQNDKKIEEYEKSQEEQKELKSQKQAELSAIQDKIAKENPDIAQKMETIQTNIEKLESEKETKVAEIDKEIETKREEAKKYQEEIGKKTGEAESLTGSKVIQDALELAQQELKKGVYEISGNNDGTEIDKYRNGAANGQPWCASFVSWIYGAGQNSDNAATFGYDASVSGIKSKAENAGYYAAKGTYTPQAGDLMIQKNNASHVGVVTGVDPDGTIHTIEGNSGDKVAERTYAPGSSGYNKISGWVQMNEWLSK